MITAIVAEMIFSTVGLKSNDLADSCMELLPFSLL